MVHSHSSSTVHVPYRAEPQLECADDITTIRPAGIIGERLDACLHHWWLTTPDANQAMLQIFRDRDRQPRRDLVPWAGEFAGKYLTSAVLGWRLTGDERLEQLITRIVAELSDVQDADGYLGPFPRSQRLVGRFKDDQYDRLMGGEYATWDLWGHYHCMAGLLLWYRATGSNQALGICRKIADLLCETFLDGSGRVRDAGAEEMNMAIIHGLCLLYRQTGEQRYLALAREIEADWEQPPAGDYVRQALAGTPYYLTPKPRWESLHDIQAIAELALLTGESKYRRAFEQIWWSIYTTDRHNTGGFSSGEQATGNPYDPRAIETCCTIAWMALSIDMLRLTGNSLVADELELSTFNGLLGGQSPSGRWWTYNTPMDGVKRSSAHDIVFQAREGSPELNCCSVNGPRGLGMLAEWSIMRREGNPVLNYYGPGMLAFRLESGGQLTLTQETRYPRDGHIVMTIGLNTGAHFSLFLRIPSWSATTLMEVNGRPITGIQAGSYHELERLWQDGDTIELDLDMRLHNWLGERECAGKVSLYYGPLLLAYDQRYNTLEIDELPMLDLQSLQKNITRLDWSGANPPWLLVSIEVAGGKQLVLCDFATAGMSGTRYCSWLPTSMSADHLQQADVPVWSRRIPDQVIHGEDEMAPAHSHSKRTL